MHHRTGRGLQSRLLFLLAALLVAGVASCRGDQAPATSISEARFIEVVVALRYAAASTGSPAEFETRREEILRQAGVTDELLLEFVRARGQDVAGMRAVWDTIAARRRAMEFQSDVQ
jgi:alkylhydroperoxidase family enzyme